ncbi:hypothetical protein FRX31_020335 [Thalictrum thalictroides]|uniref:Uncharacterized protein n=1 Tax=Thalictrum thalictroides TaxID=46969 RepID=A0A7J6VY70_THATH|nr:hypothetical protein FRX31_020335 [Thalictrum thalictroides]
MVLSEFTATQSFCHEAHKQENKMFILTFREGTTPWALYRTVRVNPHSHWPPNLHKLLRLGDGGFTLAYNNRNNGTYNKKLEVQPNYPIQIRSN